MNRIACGNDADILRPEARSLHSLTWSLYCSPLCSVAWGAYDLGFYQLCPCVHCSWEVVTKTNERSWRKKSADLCSCWNTAWQEVKAAAPGGLSRMPFPALVSLLLLLLPPPASSLPSSPSLTFSPFLFFLSLIFPFPSFTQLLDGSRFFPKPGVLT